MTDAALTIAILLGIIGTYVIRAAVGKRNGALAAVLLVAVLVRLFVAQVNITYGPLPGAEVDAVVYEQHAVEVAQHYEETGEFEWSIGRLGYSSILALAFVAGGPNRAIPPLVNSVFLVAFLLTVYEIATRLMHRRRALQCTAAVAFFPAGILYTAVPLREPVLMWALALLLYGALRYIRGEGRLFNWRFLVGYLVLVWLHSGFVVLGAWLPLLWYGAGHRVEVATRQALGKLWRALPLLAGLAVFLLGFVVVSQYLPKLPSSPKDLVNLEYLNNAREFKASYGTGYAGTAGASWLDFFFRVPAMVLGFLLSPLPRGLVSGGLTSLVQSLDAVLWLVLLVRGGQALRAEVRDKRAAAVRSAIVVLFILVVLVFAVGTANVGIAVRHRAKFAWLPMLLIFGWRTSPREEPAAPIPLREAVG